MTAKSFTSQTLSPDDLAAFEPMMKIGLVATITPDGLPHITLLSTLKGSTATTMTWGQFTEGMSFQNVLQNPKVGWLVMTLDKNLWRGRGRFTHTRTSGEDFDSYNQVPMFRYNAYFGIHTVYYLDLVEQTGKAPLPMLSVIMAAIKTIISKAFLRNSGVNILNNWTNALFNKLDNLKFLAYVDSAGFPVLVPVIQAQAAKSHYIIFSTGAFTDEIKAIPEGIPMALFGLSLDMTDVLVRGTYHGLKLIGPHHCGLLDVDWVYSPMPPVPQQIYPQLPLNPVREFDLTP